MEPSKAVTTAVGAEDAGWFIEAVAIGKEKIVADQVDFLLSLQKDLVHRREGAMVLFALCKELYARDILEEEGFEAWWKNERSENGEMGKVREKATQFMEWLRSAEEESSEEEEESE